MRHLLALASFTLLALLANTSYAWGHYKICGRWAYVYHDAAYGTDYLTHNQGSYGQIYASYTWGQLYRNDILLYAGHLDAYGCAPLQSATPGTYVLFMIPVLARSSAYVWVSNSDQQTEWSVYGAYLELPGASGTQTKTITMGWSWQANVAAFMARALYTNSVPNGWYQAYAYQDCPNKPTGASCFRGSGAYGELYYGRPAGIYEADAYMKAVIGHEMGHAVQSHMFGVPSYDYTQNGNRGWCRCDHVTEQDCEHCLTSREHISAAQLEGWAHFYASDILNRSTDTAAWFPYYKEWVLDEDGHGHAPPNQIRVYNPVGGWRWMEIECPQAQRGVELDWLGFYYELNNKTSDKYSIWEIGDVYREVCGGMCVAGTSPYVEWGDLVDATADIYGYSSDKAEYWREMGGWHGVDY
jgi:hypothetical protein